MPHKLDYQIICMCVLVAQSCLTLCDPMDCSSPGSPVHGILQARVLAGFQALLQGNLPNPEIEPLSPAAPSVAGGFFTTEPPGKSLLRTHNHKHLGINNNHFHRCIYMYG